MPSACPPDTALAELAEGLGSGQARAELQEHLDECRACRDLVAELARLGVIGDSEPEGEPVTPGVSRLSTLADSPHALVGEPRLSPGSRLGRYEIRRLLGAGGMGRVLLAWDPSLDREVAIKLVRRGGERFRARLRAEAKALARLSHPHVVTVHEIGEVGTHDFIVMEYVQGADAAEWLEGEARATDTIIEVFAQAAEGLAAAHRADVIHRDVKPTNILIGEDGRARVGDFGLARDRSLDDSGDDPSASHGSLSPHKTVDGAILGTPAYMAPEQRRGERVTEAADQYSLCVSLFEALYGRRPFSDEPDSEGARRADALAAPPNTDVPPRVHRAMVRGLSSEPEDRFPSLEALIAELRPPPPTTRRWPMYAAVAATVAAVGVTVLALKGNTRDPICRSGPALIAETWGPEQRRALDGIFASSGDADAEARRHRTHTVLDRYARRWADAHRDACEATRVRGDQTEALMEARLACLQRRRAELAALTQLLTTDPTLASRATIVVNKLTDISVCDNVTALGAAKPPPDDPAVAKRVVELERRVENARAHYFAARFAEANTLLAQVKRDAADVDFPALHGRAWLLQGQVDLSMGKSVAGEKALLEAVKYAADARDDALATAAWTQLIATVGAHQGKADALRYEPAARAALSRAGSPPRLQVPLDEAVGETLRRNGEFKKARPLLARATDGAAKAFGEDSHQLAAVLHTYGKLLRRLGDPEAASRAFARATAILEKHHGADHPRMAALLIANGNVHSVQGKPDQAKPFYDRAHRILVARGLHDHPNAITALNLRAINASERKDGATALRLWKQVLAVTQSGTKPAYRRLEASAHNSMGVFAMRRGRYADARASMRKALAMWRQDRGEEHPSVARAAHNLGEIEWLSGNHAAALPHYQEALAIRRKTYPPRHPEIASSHMAIGAALADSGQLAAGIRRLRRALDMLVQTDSPKAKTDLARARFHLGRALWESGKRDEARALVREAAKGNYDPKRVRAWMRKHRVK